MTEARTYSEDEGVFTKTRSLIEPCPRCARSEVFEQRWGRTVVDTSIVIPSDFDANAACAEAHVRRRAEERRL